MIRFLLASYHFFQCRKTVFYTVLIGITLLFFWFAFQIHFQEDINSFMPQTKESAAIGKVFKNSKVKDKIILIITSRDTTQNDPDKMIALCDTFLAQLQRSDVGKAHIKSILSKIDAGFIENMSGYIFQNSPIFLDSADYSRLDTLLQRKNLEKRIAQNYQRLISPLGLVTKRYLFDDPLGISGNAMNYLSDLQTGMQYDIYNEHIFSSNRRYLLAFISPVYGAGNIAANKVFVDEIEKTIDMLNSENPGFEIAYFGGIPISVYNERQIASDATIAVIVTALLIGLVIIFTFRRKSAIPLILLPVLFGGLFSLAFITLIQGAISTIAVGAGSTILGVAFSYSIHVFCHSLHSKSAEQIITELAYPMTIGSFTTIVAFLSMALLSSQVLHDFGLFSALALIGTTVFSLVFLPHLLVFRHQKETFLMRWIVKLNAYPFDRKKWLLIFIAIIFIISLFFFNNVTFNTDMNKLSFMPSRFAKAENVLDTAFQDKYKTVYFVSVGATTDDAIRNYTLTNSILDSLRATHLIKEYASVSHILIPQNEQKRRIDLWNAFWTPEKKEQLKKDVVQAGEKYAFKLSAFDGFFQSLDKPYRVIDYTDSDFLENSVLQEWIDRADGLTMIVSQVQMLPQNKDTVYHAFKDNKTIVILDKPYFASKMSSVVNNDFNTLLYIVSFVVFFAILLSYGRIEITLITFLPMAVSWIIILGIMAMFKIEFNIISIILSSFIFGIGDDFSIFVSDGLLSEYRNKKTILNSHKVSIFFSSFTVTVGLGAMIFSRHPALHSIAVTSIIGMLSVVVISYATQPFIFRLLISGRTAKKKFPHTWFSLLATGTALTIFVLGSLIMTLLSYLLTIIPMSKTVKQAFFHRILRYFAWFQLHAMINEKKTLQNPSNETFSKPAIIIANHQSVIDILQLLTLHPKIVMVTKEWVSKSPLFGRVARFAGFVDITQGYEPAIDRLRQCIAEGYSVAVFPEGSRSPDCKIRRFHKGAFYLAQELQADIVPVVLHGNGQAMSKDDVLYLKNAALAARILPRIAYADGESYQEKCKRISALFKAEHALFAKEIDNSRNPYYRYKLIKNYQYKSPVLEWYLRIKVAMEKDYRPFERLISPQATITDIGCGYGFLSYMLAFKSDERTITGIDYDEDKIEVANNNFSKTERMRFVAADAADYDFEPSDVFILNDMLHYLPKEKQDKLLAKCVEKLNACGKIIVRDGDRDKDKKHGLTRLTELFSTKIIKFNKTENPLYFLSTEEIKTVAQSNRLMLSMIENDKYSSNTIYILEKS